MSYSFVKRAFDLACSLLGLIALAPLLLVVSILIKLTMKGPIFFTQARPGVKGRIFKMYKFRTMIANPELSDAQRITWLGRILRKTSIDELPELWNVMK